MLQNTLIDKWWRNHKRFSGEVHLVRADWKLLGSPEKYIDNLFTEYRKLSLEQIMDFVRAEVTDNEMPYREILEDGSKIQYLRKEIQGPGLNFLPSLLHEPWLDRYRIHPGSGRAAAMYLEGIKEFDCIYIHFEENNFAVPQQHTELDLDLFREKLNEKKKAYYETYFAFPKTAKDCAVTLNMDREWQWHHVKTYAPWKFIRWSEGPDFLTYKQNWRNYAIDLWEELQ